MAKSPKSAEAAPETPKAVVSTLGDAPAEVQREPVVEELTNGTVKETF